jgi:hypothetical protein
VNGVGRMERTNEECGADCVPKSRWKFLTQYVQGSNTLCVAQHDWHAAALSRVHQAFLPKGLAPLLTDTHGCNLAPCRFPPATKAAILVTLGQLIRRAGAGLKPFVPQLQTTFVKCLSDQVRGLAQGDRITQRAGM